MYLLKILSARPRPLPFRLRRNDAHHFVEALHGQHTAAQNGHDKYHFSSSSFLSFSLEEKDLKNLPFRMRFDHVGRTFL